MAQLWRASSSLVDSIQGQDAMQAGVIGLTKTVAREFAGRGITCNAVAPGFIASDMTANIDPKYEEAIIGQIPLSECSPPASSSLLDYIRMPSHACSIWHCFVQVCCRDGECAWQG